MIEQLKAAIIAQVNARVPVQTVWAECVGTDVASGTMTATANGLEYDDVLLGLGDDITVPEPNSKVLLGLVGNKAEATWLIYAERIALRYINGNAKGGLVVANTVRQADTALLNKVNQLIAVLTAWTPTVPPTLADIATLKMALTTWCATPLVPVVPNAYENPKVYHG